MHLTKSLKSHIITVLSNQKRKHTYMAKNYLSLSQQNFWNSSIVEGKEMWNNGEKD